MNLGHRHGGLSVPVGAGLNEVRGVGDIVIDREKSAKNPTTRRFPQYPNLQEIIKPPVFGQNAAKHHSQAKTPHQPFSAKTARTPTSGKSVHQALFAKTHPNTTVRQKRRINRFQQKRPEPPPQENPYTKHFSPKRTQTPFSKKTGQQPPSSKIPGSHPPRQKRQRYTFQQVHAETNRPPVRPETRQSGPPALASPEHKNGAEPPRHATQWADL